MNTGLTANERSAPKARFNDYIELTKPRIVTLEIVAVVVTMHIATGYGAPGSAWNMLLLFAVALGAALVGGSANAINQWMERDLDAQMTRTANRPIPAGRLTPFEAAMFGLVTLIAGSALLGYVAGPVPLMLGLGTWVLYVAVYTPLKVRSWTNTAVGAVTGAAPLMIGWTAAGGSVLDPMVLALAAIMYVWQFPHFMAIAWMYRDDYLKVDYQMSTAIDTTGWWAGMQAIVGSLLLLPISMAPLWVSSTISPWLYAVPMILAGLMMVLFSIRFFRDRNDRTARLLLRASLVYVPVWLLATWIAGA